MTRRIVPRLIAAALSAGAVLLFVLPAAAQDAPPVRTITVSGTGEIAATPDEARLSAGVVAEAAAAKAALADNNAAMTKVFAALRAQGIAEKNIQTSDFSVSPQYTPYRQDDPQPRKIIGYQVSNQVTVVVDDLSKLGSTLDALVNSGANQLNGVSFTIADPKPLMEKARRAAVEDAMAKAKTIAEAAQVTLGPVLTIQEGGGNISSPRPMAFKVAASEAVPIAAGQTEITVDVTVRYAIQ